MRRLSIFIIFCSLALSACDSLDKNEREQIEIELFDAADAIIRHSDARRRLSSPLSPEIESVFDLNRSFYNKTGAVYETVNADIDPEFAKYKKQYDSLANAMARLMREPTFAADENLRVSPSVLVPSMLLDIAVRENELLNLHTPIPKKRSGLLIAYHRIFNGDRSLMLLSHPSCEKNFIVTIFALDYDLEALPIRNETYDNGHTRLRDGTELRWHVPGEKVLSGLSFRNIGPGSYFIQGYMKFDNNETLLPFEYQFKVK